MSMSISEFASRVGVSKNTVSRAFREGVSIHPETRERIRRLARELGYRPNPSARALKTSVSKSVGIIIGAPGTEPAYLSIREYAPLIQRLAHELAMRGHTLMIASVHDEVSPDSRLTQLPKIVEEAHASHLIVLSHMWPELVQALNRLEIPTVVIDGPSCGLPAVQRDESGAVEMLVDHLVKAGHTRIAFVNHPPSSPTGYYRDELWPRGYFKALTRHQLVPMPGWDIFEDQVASIDRLVTLRQPPTAIIVYDDQVAIHVIGLLRERGMKVPADVSIAAMSDLGIGDSHYPPVTRVSTPHETMARFAVEHLLDQSSTVISENASVFRLEGRIIEGGTIAAPKI